MAKRPIKQAGVTAGANVAYKRKELDDYTGLYQMIDDAVAGSTRVKARRTKYLPDPGNGTDEARYTSYLMRAVFYAVTRRTLTGFVGEIFDKDPVIVVPAQMQPLIEDTSGEGVGIVQLAKKVVKLTLALGRSGLFVDFPQTAGAVTRADLEQAVVRPVIKHYHPTKIINWRYRKFGAVSKLSLVVLEEDYDAEDDGFEVVKSTQWRILRLDAAGNYTVQLVQKVGRAGMATPSDPITPTDADGKPFDEIPFMFVGSETNDAEIDYPPFYDMADLNIAHYRNSADHEETLFVGSQPTLVVTGLTEAWVDKFYPKGIPLGSRASISLPVGAEAKFVEVTARTANLEEMEHKERQMVALGAKLVEQKQVQRTATESSTETASEKSTLVTVADNVSNAFEWALYFAAKFIGLKDNKITFELNKQYSISFSTPEARKEAIEAWVAEAISFTEMRSAIRKGGTATLPDDQARKEIMKDRELMADLTEVDPNDPNADPNDTDPDPAADPNAKSTDE